MAGCGTVLVENFAYQWPLFRLGKRLVELAVVEVSLTFSLV